METIKRNTVHGNVVNIWSRNKNKSIVNPDIILEALCHNYDTTREELFRHNKIRDAKYKTIRQIIFFYNRYALKFSLKECGKTFNQDHATAVHGIKRVKDMIYTNDEYYMSGINTLARYASDQDLSLAIQLAKEGRL